MQQLQSEQILQRQLRHQSAQFACFYQCLKFECRRGITSQVRTEEREKFKIEKNNSISFFLFLLLKLVEEKGEGNNLIFISKKLKSTANLI